MARGEIDDEPLSIAGNDVCEPTGEKLEIAVLGHEPPVVLLFVCLFRERQQILAQQKLDIFPHAFPPTAAARFLRFLNASTMSRSSMLSIASSSSASANRRTHIASIVAAAR